MIQSILDTDLYKFSMGYFYFKKYPYAEGIFEFVDRDPEATYDQAFLTKFELALENLEKLSLSQDELEWCCEEIPYIPRVYWEWLSSFRFNRSLLEYSIENGKFRLRTKLARLCIVSLYETPLLAIITNLKMENKEVDMGKMMERLKKKVELSNENKLLFSEFGTRRRFSFNIQDDVVSYLSEHAEYCTGTSNVYLAKKYGVKPIGTCAHELCSFIASQYGYKHPNYILMEQWADVYKGNLGIYLTDTFTTDTFLRDFTLYQAKLWDGVRHDSGDPFEYIKKIVNKYLSLGIDPKEKTIIFSNSLTMPEYAGIAKACAGQIKCAAGIGTNLTNDTGNKPANVVMKLVASRLSPDFPIEYCIKISDDVGKHIGNEEEFELAKKVLKL